MPSKSSLWQHFVRNADQSGTCRHCGKTLKTKGNTSNLKCHLQSKHPNIFSVFKKSIKTNIDSSKPKQPKSVDKLDNIQGPPTTSGPFTQLVPLKADESAAGGGSTVSIKESQPSSSASICSVGATPKDPHPRPYQATIANAFRKIESFKEGGDRNQKITQAIVYMICKDCQPFSIVEHTGFNKLMKTVAPQYKVPSRFTIKRLINEKFELIASVMRQKLSNKKCTLTTDIWMDPQTRSFLSLTVHFYDEDQDRLIFSGTIGVFMLEERHTGLNLANELKLICLEWNICDEDVIAVATDNAANITLAVEIAFGKNRHVPCFAHTLNLVTEKGIELSNDATVLIGKVKSIVTWFKHSGVASDELRKLTDKRPVQSVPTRWNSVFIC